MAFQKAPPKVKESKALIVAPEGNAAKFKQLLAVATALNTKHQTTNSLVKLGDKIGQMLPSISTGLAMLDYEVFQCGGVPEDRIIEIFGPESAGKTSVSLQCIAMCQELGGMAAFVDAEHALDPNYAKVLGVNVDELLVSQPNNGEEALDIIEALVQSRCVNLIVVDSVAALVPKAELEGEITDANVGLHARLMSKAMRRLTPMLAHSKCSIIFINQIREKIGVMFGNPETTTGGRALKFFASVRLDVRRQSGGEFPVLQNANKDLIGHTIKVKAIKNKCGVPFRECYVDLYYDSGFDREESLIRYASTRGLFEKAGSWFVVDGKNVANGLDNMIRLVKTERSMFERVQAAVQKQLAADRLAASTKAAA